MPPIDSSQLLSAIGKNPRARLRNEHPVSEQGRVVVYWMQRAQRAVDNPALDCAIQVANRLRQPVCVFLGIVPFYQGANLRHYAFVVGAVAELAEAVRRRGAAFVFRPYPDHRLIPFCDQVGASIVIGDENPLREPERWRRVAGERLRVPLVTVDADVVMPTALAPKEEVGARTLRPKIHRVLAEFLRASAEPTADVAWSFPVPPSVSMAVDDVLARLPIARDVQRIADAQPGTSAGLAELDDFVARRLSHYGDARNQPDIADGTSLLSAYLHYGHLGPRQVALAAIASRAPQAAKDAFIEQLIVRRELAINFCARNPQYDSFDGMAPWAQATLQAHAADVRPHRYSMVELDAACTHDPLWNAAQNEMKWSGRTHGYVRMYWAKKILEWSATPQEAFANAIALNDKYFLDGRDPNGYTGIAWALGGKHDRPWPERPIFGTIRFMSYASTSKKFDCQRYIERVERMRPDQGPRQLP